MTATTPPNGGPARPPRAPRLGDSRSPVTTTAVLVGAAIAVLAGFLILRSITEPKAGPVAADTATPTAVAATPTTAGATTTAPTTSTTTTTTTAPASKSDAVVIVANASGVGGTATEMTEALVAAGYTTAGVANTNGRQLEQSIIYFVEDDPDALGVARLLAEQIPTANTVPMPDAPPLDRPLGTATVALLLGLDAAGQPLAEPD